MSKPLLKMSSLKMSSLKMSSLKTSLKMLKIFNLLPRIVVQDKRPSVRINRMPYYRIPTRIRSSEIFAIEYGE
jgi:hypothetical protein